MIIGCISRAGGGKDTFFKIVYDLWESKFTITNGKKIEKIYHRQYENIKFAAKVKEVCSIITGYPIETFYNREKYNDTISNLGGNLAIRTLMQKVGDGLRREVADDIWIRAAFSKVTFSSEIIVTDCRYPNEAEFIKSKGGILIKIIRPNHEESTITGEQAKHASETQIDSLPYDYLITNNGTLEDFKTQIVLLMESLWKQEE